MRGSVVARGVVARLYEEVGGHGVEGVVFECCGGRDRGRACVVACSGGPGHNESPPHYPLGPCRGGVCGVVA